jgi:hypothetical protein
VGAVLASQISLLQHVELLKETHVDAGLIGKTARIKKCVVFFLTSEAHFFIGTSLYSSPDSNTGIFP